jgi:hypothetical protein
MKTFFFQKVNQGLCFALIGLMTFWTTLFYFTHKAEAIGNDLAAEYQSEQYQ